MQCADGMDRMFDEVLRQIQARIRVLQYAMTIHAEEEMSDDGGSL